MAVFKYIRHLGLSLMILSPLSCVVGGYYCCPGYLAIVGPVPMDFSEVPEVFDREELFIIEGVEANLEEDAKAREVVDNTFLEKEHKENVEKVEAGVAPLLVESPEPRIEEPAVIVEQPTVSPTPADFLYLINKDNNMDTDGVGIINVPFDVPYGSGGPTKISVPSKAVFEQR